MGGAPSSQANKKNKEGQKNTYQQNKKNVLNDKNYQEKSKLQQQIEEQNNTFGNPVTFTMQTHIQEQITNLQFQYRLAEENNYGKYKQIINKYFYEDITIQQLKDTLKHLQYVVQKNKLYQKFKSQQFFPLHMIQDHENQQVFFEVYLEKCIMQFQEYIHRIQEISQNNQSVNDVYNTEAFKWVKQFKENIEEQYQQNQNIEKEYENELFMDDEYEKVSQNDKFKVEINDNYMKYDKNQEIINPKRVYEETYEFMKNLKGINKEDIIYIQNQMPNFLSFNNCQGAWGSSYYALNSNKKKFLQFYQYCNENAYRRHLEQAKMFQQEYSEIIASPVVWHNQYSKIIILERGCMDLQYFLKLKRQHLLKANAKNPSFDKNSPVLKIEELYYLMYFIIENFIHLFENNIIFSDIKLNHFQLFPLRDKKTNKIIKNKYTIKFVPDQMAQYFEDIDFYFPQRYTPFHYKQETLNLASQRKLTKQEIFQSQMYSIGKCIQKCIDPVLETRKNFEFDDFFEIYEESYLGPHLAQVIKNMEGYNKDKMTEWYEHFEVITKDIAYSCHYKGIYASDCLEDEFEVIPKFHEQIIKNANTAKVISEKKSEKLMQFSLKQLQDEILFYGQFSLYEQQQKSIECLIDHYDQLHNGLEDNEQNKELKTQYQNKIADIYQDLALNLQKQKKADEALEYYNDSLDIKEALYGKNDYKLLKTLMAIGKMSYEENFLNDAEDKFKRALHLVQDQFTEKHYLTSPVITKLGKTLQKAQRYNEAIYFLLEALDNKAAFFGENHVQLAQDLNNLGQVYEEQGNLNKALKVYRKSLSILQKHYGKQHPELTKTQTNIADILHQQNLSVEALQIIQQNLKITQEFYGEQHVANGRHEFAIGILYRESGRFKEGLAFLEKAQEKYYKYYGEDHKNYVKIMKEVNGCRKDLKNEEQYD